MLLSENNNKDIVACDQNADVMVVLDRRGLVRFRYNKKPPRGQKPFSPWQVVTDDVTSHIIVVDAKNSCLHILNQNGQSIPEMRRRLWARKSVWTGHGQRGEAVGGVIFIR